MMTSERMTVHPDLSERSMPADTRTATVEWLEIIRGEYLEVPGLNLTKPQVRRMWSLDAVQCDAILDALTEARFLRQTASGAYVRADGGGR